MSEKIDFKSLMDPQLKQIWNQKAASYGQRCVINLLHPPESFDSITAQQKNVLFPMLKPLLSGREKKILDFGCGPGRFSHELSSITGAQVLGFDISQDLVKLAHASDNVRFTSEPEDLDSSKESFDLIWICLVFGGIGEDTRAEMARNLVKLLRTDGMIFLVEHTSENEQGSKTWHFRPERYYKEIFRPVELTKRGSYLDFNKEVSVFAGRKQ